MYLYCLDILSLLIDLYNPYITITDIDLRSYLTDYSILYR